MRVTLVVPTLNEAPSIAHVIRLFRTAAAEANATVYAGDPVEWEVRSSTGRRPTGPRRSPRRRALA